MANKMLRRGFPWGYHLNAGLPITSRRRKISLAELTVAEAGKPLKAARVEVESRRTEFSTAAEIAVREGRKVLPLDLLKGNEGRLAPQTPF
jgi:acyl-CoA reductase-like NAD-dependent aldehyde dehydrogenase